MLRDDAKLGVAPSPPEFGRKLIKASPVSPDLPGASDLAVAGPMERTSLSKGACRLSEKGEEKQRGGRVVYGLFSG
jgi:hypothetical protein